MSWLEMRFSAEQMSTMSSLLEYALCQGEDRNNPDLQMLRWQFENCKRAIISGQTFPRGLTAEQAQTQALLTVSRSFAARYTEAFAELTTVHPLSGTAQGEGQAVPLAAALTALFRKAKTIRFSGAGTCSVDSTQFHAVEDGIHRTIWHSLNDLRCEGFVPPHYVVEYVDKLSLSPPSTKPTEAASRLSQLALIALQLSGMKARSVAITEMEDEEEECDPEGPAIMCNAKRAPIKRGDLMADIRSCLARLDQPLESDLSCVDLTSTKDVGPLQAMSRLLRTTSLRTAKLLTIRLISGADQLKKLTSRVSFIRLGASDFKAIRYPAITTKA